MQSGNKTDQLNRGVVRRGRAGRDRGRGECGGMGRGSGARGRCVCPKCGRTEEHVPGVPCMQERCPDCGAAMLREGSPHHVESVARRAVPERLADGRRKGDE